VLPNASAPPEALTVARVDARVALLRASGHSLLAVRTLLECKRCDDAVALLDVAIAAAAAATGAAGPAGGGDAPPTAAAGGAATASRGGILAVEAAAEAARAAAIDASAARLRMAVENSSFAGGVSSSRGTQYAAASGASLRQPASLQARPWSAEAALVCALFHEVLRYTAAAADAARLASLWPRRPPTYGLWSMLAALRSSTAPSASARRGSITGPSGDCISAPHHCPVRGERGVHVMLGDLLPQLAASSAEAVAEAGAISAHWRERGLSLQGRGAVLRDFPAGSPAWR
jgi:hypothetical protein